MKKKIFSLLVSICLVFVGLFGFSGCSLVKPDKEKLNSNIVMKVGDKSLTKNDVINAFYTYYQTNSSYFSYYDSKTIEESFYTWLTVKTLIEQLSDKALYDEDTNPTGYMYYTNEDAKQVWKNVEDYVYSQISSYEKAIYDAEGYETDDYPVWLKDDEAEEEKSQLKPFESVASDLELKDRSLDVVKKLTDDEVYSKVDALKANLFKYIVSGEDEENPVREAIDDTDYISGARNQAYANYMQSMISNAKANGTTTNENEILKTEILRIYNAFYDSQISIIFQNFWTQEYLFNFNNARSKAGVDASVLPAGLSNSEIVSKFLSQYNTDFQTYQIEDAYVSEITNSEGVSLVLYHYDGKDYYFTVQHILVSDTEYISEQVKALEGYSTSSDYSSVISSVYRTQRDNIISNHNKAMLCEIKEDSVKNTITPFGNYYYYDETKKDVYDQSTNTYYGYVQLTTRDVSYDSTKNQLTVVYKDISTLENTDYETLSASYSDVKFMASVDDILASYSSDKSNFTVWCKLVDQILDDSDPVLNDVTGKDNIVEDYEDIEYVLDVIYDMKANNSSMSKQDLASKIKTKLASMLFIELEWVYSGDTLKNELSNKMGYVISNQPDQNGSWVVDFAVGAREAVEEMKSKTADQKMTYTNTIISDYGYHIIKVEDIYECGSSIIDFDSVVATFDLTENSDYVNEIVGLMKKTYLCNCSNETLYNYFYDEIYSSLIGSSSSSGSYFLAVEYYYLNKFYTEGKISITNKISYDDLISELS